MDLINIKWTNYIEDENILTGEVEKNPNAYEVEGSEGGLSGVLKLLRSEFCIWERNSSRILQEFFKKLIGIIKFMKIPNSSFLQRMINF